MKYGKTLLALVCTITLTACTGGDGESAASGGGGIYIPPSHSTNSNVNPVSKNKDVAEVDLVNHKVTQFNNTSTDIDQLVINGKTIPVPKRIITSSDMINGVNKTSLTQAYPDTGVGKTLRYGIVKNDDKFYIFHKGDLTSLSDMQKIDKNGGIVKYIGHAYKLNSNGTDILDSVFNLSYIPRNHTVKASTIAFGEHESSFEAKAVGNKFVSYDGKTDGAFYGNMGQYVGAKTVDKENNNYVIYGGMKLLQLPAY